MPSYRYSLEDPAANQLVEGIGAPHVRLAQRAVGFEAQLRERLRRRHAIPARGALRDRLLGRRHQQAAVATVEHVDVAALARCDQRRHLALRGVQVDQARLPADVHVPQVVVHGLVDPAQLSAGDVERDDRNC